MWERGSLSPAHRYKDRQKELIYKLWMKANTHSGEKIRKEVISDIMYVPQFLDAFLSFF